MGVADIPNICCCLCELVNMSRIVRIGDYCQDIVVKIHEFNHISERNRATSCCCIDCTDCRRRIDCVCDENIYIVCNCEVYSSCSRTRSCWDSGRYVCCDISDCCSTCTIIFHLFDCSILEEERDRKGSCTYLFYFIRSGGICCCILSSDIRIRRGSEGRIYSILDCYNLLSK